MFGYLRRGGTKGAVGGFRLEMSLSPVLLRTEMPDISPGVETSWPGVEIELQCSRGVSRLGESDTVTEGVDILLNGLPGVGFTT